jgi:hypothetical protein
VKKMTEEKKTVEGFLEAISQSEVSTKYGMRPKHSLKIKGVWYNGWGSAPEELTADSHVSITYKDTDYGPEIMTVRKIVDSIEESDESCMHVEVYPKKKMEGEKIDKEFFTDVNTTMKEVRKPEKTFGANYREKRVEMMKACLDDAMRVYELVDQEAVDGDHAKALQSIATSFYIQQNRDEYFQNKR